ncbi:MAG: DUF362 domain-containing protein [Verrucomicrobiia bacterium]
MATLSLSSLCALGATNTVSESRVVLAQDSSAVHSFDVDAVKVRRLVATGIKSLTSQRDEMTAWATLVSSNDVVGIKIDTQLAPLHTTHRAVVEAIADGLRAAGVAATNIIVWDRDASKMTAAGFMTVGQTPSLPRGAAARGSPSFRSLAVSPDGWDATAFYAHRVVGRLVWGDLLFGKVESDIDTRSHLPLVLTKIVTKFINVPVLHDHDTCGMAGCLYNMSVGAVDNQRRFETPGQRNDSAIADICALPQVRDKLVLNVMDGLVGGYAGGAAFKPQYSWNYGGLFFSRDPVAVDTVVLELLEAKRREANVSAIGSLASHITAAGRLGLGQSDRAKIELITASP